MISSGFDFRYGILNNETYLQPQGVVLQIGLFLFASIPDVSLSGLDYIRKGGKRMSLIELFLLAVGLSMDAFAVSICKGLSMQKLDVKKMVIVGLYFGGFQALMPTLGYLLGVSFKDMISAIDHWIAFVLLGLIGISMNREACSGEEESVDASVTVKAMVPLAVATSIDALAAGVTFAFLDVSIVWAVSFIGVITFTFSMIGVKVGNGFGTRYQKKAEVAGGVILILLGTKILLEHLGVLAF